MCPDSTPIPSTIAGSISYNWFTLTCQGRTMYKKSFHENRKQAYNKCLLSFLASNANISLKTKKILAYFLIINIQFVVLILISSISLPSQSTLFTRIFNLFIVLELPTLLVFPKLTDAINGLSFNNMEISVLFPLWFYCPLSSRLNLINLKMLPRSKKQFVNYMSER